MKKPDDAPGGGRALLLRRAAEVSVMKPAQLKRLMARVEARKMQRRTPRKAPDR